MSNVFFIIADIKNVLYKDNIKNIVFPLLIANFLKYKLPSRRNTTSYSSNRNV